MSDKRQRAKEFLRTVDWSTYDFREAEGADLSFPDYDGTQDLPVWFSNHYNKTSGMQCRHLPDLNAIDDGKQRRLWALYGVPVEWDFEDKAKTQQYIQTIEASRAAGPDVFAQTLSQYGMLNEEHFEWMKVKSQGGEEYVADLNRYQNIINETTERLKQERQALIDGALKDELQPVEGVSMQQWAGLQAAAASGQDVTAMAAQQGIDAAKWARVSDEWNARMARDTTATIASVYGQAFTGAGQGQFAAAGQAAAGAMNPGGSVEGSAEPVPFERWIEITVAQEALTAQGQDASSVLAQFGITPADWGTIGAWWGQKFTANAMSMMDDYNQLTAKFRAKYGLQDTEETSDDLEERVKGEIIALAQADRGGEIIAHLKKMFPDDADDNDALDHHVDMAADEVGEKGDKKTALVLCHVRYDLSEQDESREEFVESAMDLLF